MYVCIPFNTKYGHDLCKRDLNMKKEKFIFIVIFNFVYNNRSQSKNNCKEEEEKYRSSDLCLSNLCTTI